MLFPEEDTAALKAWVVKRLENTSDADADVLADYVLALLSHDGDKETIRKLCESEIPDFLKEDAAGFVDDVFRAIDYKAYLPGARPAPPRTTRKPSFTTASGAQSQATSLEGPYAANLSLSASHAQNALGGPFGGFPLPNMPQAPLTASSAASGSNRSRKRGFQDFEAPSGPEGAMPEGPRVYKQPRRGAFGGRGGRWSVGGGHGRNGPPPPSIPPPMSGGRLPGPSLPPFDPNRPLDAILALQAMGVPLPDMFAPGGLGAYGQQQQEKRRQRCRDFDTKGYCTRGTSCPYEHVRDGMVVGAGSPQDESYDPTSLMNGFSPMPLPMSIISSTFGSPNHSNGQSRRQRNGRENSKKASRNRGAGPATIEGPVLDQTKTTLVVQNIPEQHLSDEDVRGFFTQFGNILEITIQAHRRLAIVKFDTWGAANAAYRSPKVIFDNRFVKVFWLQEHDDTLQSSASNAQGRNGSARGKGRREGTSRGGRAANGHASPQEAGDENEDTSMGGTEGEIDMDDFLRKMEAAQKSFEEKTAKKQDLDRQRSELEERQKELLMRQRDTRRKLHAKLAEAGRETNDESVRSGGSDGPEFTLGNSTGSGAANGIQSGSGGGSSVSEALRAQLAALEEEAVALGIDPNALDDQQSTTSSQFGASSYYSTSTGTGYSFSYRARGRGSRFASYRGRYPGSGGFRGRGSHMGRGDVHAAYAAYSLDNRPRSVAVVGLDFTAQEKDEALRQYLLGVGEFTNIHTNPTTTTITFIDRKTAEKFFYGLNGRQLPSLEGKLELSWVSNTALAPAITSTTTTATTTTTAASPSPQPDQAPSSEPARPPSSSVKTAPNGTAETEGVDELTPQHRDHEHDHENDQAEMDYDVADENDWN